MMYYFLVIWAKLAIYDTFKERESAKHIITNALVWEEAANLG